MKYSGRQHRVTAFILAVLLLAVSVPSGLAGCSGQDTALAGENTAPFYSDRVVEVRFVIPEGDWEYMQEHAMEEQYVRSDMWYDGGLIEDIALRPKGNSSLMTTVSSGSIRFGLKADLNFFNSARNLDGVKKLNFNNGFSDPTFMRETLAYDIYRQMDVPAPRTSFVDVWINDTHMGLYTMVEQIDTTFLSDNFRDGTGNLYKPEMPSAALKWTEADYKESPAGQKDATEEDESAEINLGGGPLSDIMEALGMETAEEEEETARGFPGRSSGFKMPGMPRNEQDLVELMGLKTNENKPDHSGLFRFLEVLNNEPAETFEQEIEKVLDVDETLRFLAVSTALVHLDNYTGIFGHNYYLYEENGKFTVLPWDMNMAFGTFDSGLDRDGIINFLIDEPTAVPPDERPLVSRLLAVPEYLETYHGYLDELINGPFSPDVIDARVSETADMIRPYVEADTLKFYPTRAFEINLRAGMNDSRMTNPMQLSIGLGAFVSERCDSIRRQLAGELPSTNDGKGNVGTGSVIRPGFQNRQFVPPRRER